MKRHIDTHTLQCWPGGASFTYQGDIHGPASQRRLRARTNGNEREPRWRKGTADEWRQIRIAVQAEIYSDRDILCCQSSLVDDILKRSHERGEAFEDITYDDIQNQYPDPDGWTLEECREYASDRGLGEPDPNPWNMDRAALVELLNGASIDTKDNETIDTLREAVIVNIDDETINGIKDWREACRDHAQENPAEIYEWWLVTGWLCDQLKAAGECVIDAGMGCRWWGRTCTGQGYIMDGTLQRIAAKFVREDEKAEAA